MRPIESGEIGDLLDWKPMMLLDKTLFGPAFVDSLVSRSPTFIKSKGGKELPLELWISILDFAVANGPEPHDYAFVRPFTLGRRQDDGKLLFFQRFKRWTSFGTIQDIHGVEDYHLSLALPDRNFNRLHTPFMNREYGHPIGIPTELLDSKIDFLHVKLTVPDVIKYMEGGRCRICWGARTIGGNGVGCKLAHSFLGKWSHIGWEITVWDARFDLPILCPLCVGIEHTMDCVRREVQRDQPYDTQRADYISWLETRLQELGFGTISVPRLPPPPGLRPSGGYLFSN
ncbi:hypothetical protein BKA59DRAFT_517960 [Fusarium tricinctum]|uniref:Uncharacterized protein n=1 Tax=Fusarium tricinctum TaxID=61284 RepID=A0A8K0RLW8_9HYPO|nr:hypothetical protein BKA59DRAFT_517960 [Fusarium tricinctum]